LVRFFKSVSDLPPPPKKKEIREKKFENIFSLGDEMYGDITIREGVL
jgi:hypothetical protein